MIRVSAPLRSGFLPAIVLGAIMGGSFPQAQAQPPKAQAANARVALPAQLQYGFEVGKTYHYKLVALFSGQIPSLSDPGTDTHVRVQLYYSATVLKQDAKGSKVAFAVEAEDLSFLAKEPDKDGRINPDDELPFPLPLAQVQGFLNVTALLKPDGSIAEVSGGNNDPVKIHVGVDLRKLFVLMLPIVFPDHPVSPGLTWNFDEGFLGKNPGSTTYTGKIDAVNGDANHVVFQVSQSAKSTVLDKIDKEGNSTPDAKLQVGAITGDVSATGSMNFGATKVAGADAKIAGYTGRLISGSMTLAVSLKRTMPDPEHPDKTKVDPITVHGRMTVQIQPGPPKPDAAVASGSGSVTKTEGTHTK